MLNWASRFNICSFLDNHRYHFGPHAYECLAGVGALHSLSAPAGNALQEFDRFRAQHPGWLFGHLGYGLGEETVGPGHTPRPPEEGEARDPVSGLPDLIGFPDLFFFVPEIVLLLNDTELAIASYGGKTAAEVFEAIRSVALPGNDGPTGPVDIQSRFSR